MPEVDLPRPVGFVLGGGGSLGAMQVGMLRALTEAGIRPVTVTFTHGLTRVPADLRGICIGLVSAQMDAIENDLGLSIGGLSSIQLDDFKVGFADGGDKTGLYLAEHHQRYLARKYGTTAWVRETRP